MVDSLIPLLCSVGGDVRIWDPRFMKSVHSFNVVPSLTACEIHPRAPLLAWYVVMMPCASYPPPFIHPLPSVCSASQQHAIRIYSLDTDEMINQIRYHDGFMGLRIGPTKSLTFHPYKVCNFPGEKEGVLSMEIAQSIALVGYCQLAVFSNGAVLKY